MLRYVFIMFTICLEEEKVERNKKNRTKRQENGPDRLVAQKRCATESWSPFGRFLEIFEYLLDIRDAKEF